MDLPGGPSYDPGMRTTLLAALLLAACSSELEPVPDAGTWTADASTPDGGPPIVLLVDADAGAPADAGEDVSTRVDAGTDAGGILPPDGGILPPDAGTSPDPDAGAPTSPDASSPPPDAGTPVGCSPDALEPNDEPGSALLVASGTGWPASTYPMTWHEGDAADWIAADLDSTGVVALFRVHAADDYSMVEVRVSCRAGLVVCRGSGATRSGTTCVGRRLGNAYVDVGCNTAEPAAVDVLVGVEHDPASSACGHELRVSLSAP